jgi:hypothetical protein
MIFDRKNGHNYKVTFLKRRYIAQKENSYQDML